MDSYVTTYGKDYKWPYVRSMAVRAEEPYLTTLPCKERQKVTIPSCQCKQEQPKVLGPDNYSKTWCKPGPNPPLLTPVVFYAEQPPAQRDVARFDNPNTFLKQLYEKYPYLYSVLQSSPPDELIRRIKNARYISTYQADYDHIGEGNSTNYDQLVANAFQTTDPCAKYGKIGPDSSTERYVRPKLITKSLDHRELKNARGPKVVPEPARTSAETKPGISEYMDSISKLGGIIIKEKLLTRQRK